MIVANAGTSTVSLLLNTTAPGATTPTFATKVDLAVPARFVTLADLNGDGRPPVTVV